MDVVVSRSVGPGNGVEAMASLKELELSPTDGSAYGPASLKATRATKRLSQKSKTPGKEARDSESEAKAVLASLNTINHLRDENKLLWYKLHVFMYDLRHYRSDHASVRRLESLVSLDYIGQPYFSNDEAQTLRNVVVGDGRTFKETLGTYFESKLKSRLESRAKSQNDYRICAAHDLAPVVEKAIGVRQGDLKKNKQFNKLMKSRGLELKAGDVWKGIGSARRG